MKVFLNPTNFGVGKLNHLRNTEEPTNTAMTPLKPMACDAVSFSARPVLGKKVTLDTNPTTVNRVGNSLSTSTSGHRAIYGTEDFSHGAIMALTLGAAKYVKDEAAKKGQAPMVIVGGDANRPATNHFKPLIAKVMQKQGVNVTYIKDPVPTPLLALLTKEMGNPLSILLTPSHNPWNYGGYNLVTPDGAIAPQEVTQKVTGNMDEMLSRTTNKNGKVQMYYREAIGTPGIIKEMYPYDLYKNALNKLELVNWTNIKNSNISIHYDHLHGAGQYVTPRLLTDNGIKHDVVKSSKKEGPNPVDKNLPELKAALAKDTNALKIGLANDGDADRFGVLDENGTFITPNDVILLTAYHLAKNKGKTGPIIRSQATSSQIDLFAKQYNIPVIETPVGFKYIGKEIEKLREEHGDILVAGEESGGLTVNGHIPEKDGILAVLLMADLVATEKRPLSVILQGIKDDLHTNFRSQPKDIKLEDSSQKQVIMGKMEAIYKDAVAGNLKFGDFTIDLERTRKTMESMKEMKPDGDGIKLFFTDEGGSSLLVRPSGTEPKIKCYVETSNKDAKVADDTVAKLHAEFAKIAAA